MAKATEVLTQPLKRHCLHGTPRPSQGGMSNWGSPSLETGSTHVRGGERSPPHWSATIIIAQQLCVENICAIRNWLLQGFE